MRHNWYIFLFDKIKGIVHDIKDDPPFCFDWTQYQWEKYRCLSKSDNYIHYLCSVI